MRRLLTIVAVCGGLTAAALAQAPAPAPPPDTAALRAQYERWRTEFKTWGKWAPVGQEEGRACGRSELSLVLITKKIGNRMMCG